MEIVTGVHQLRIPFPEGIERFTNAYVIEGNRGSILVDCGWDSSEAIWAFREQLRIERLSFAVTEPLLRPIRRLLYRFQAGSPIDFSPLVLYLLIELASRLLIRAILAV